MADNQSFLPEDYLEKRAQRRTNFISLTLFVIVMAGVFGAYYVTNQQRNEVAKHLSEVNEQFVYAAQQLDQYEKLQARREEMVRKAQVTGTLLERVPRSVLLAELINSMPPNLSLLDLKVDTKVISRAPRPTTAMEKAKNKKNKSKESDSEFHAPETEVNIVLTGVAPTDVQVAQFMTTLGQNEMFTDQHLGFSEETTIQKLNMRKFRVDIQLSPDMDVQTHKPTMVKRDSIPNPMAETMELNLENQLNNKNDAGLRSDVIPSN